MEPTSKRQILDHLTLIERQFEPKSSDKQHSDNTAYSEPTTEEAIAFLARTVRYLLENKVQ